METKAVSDNSEGERSLSAVVSAQSKASARDVTQVDMSGLRKLNIRPNLGLYVKQLIERRHFIVADARYRAFRTVKSYRLWKFWLIGQPLLEAAMYGVLFGLVLKTSRGIDNFIGFLVLGVTFFGFVSSLVGGGQSLIQTSRNLITAFSFPRASLVLSQSLRYMIDNIAPILVAVVFALCAQWGKPLSPTIPLFIPITLLMWLFGTGFMFMVARITAFIPDAKVLINLAMRAWFFSSGVFFSVERYASSALMSAVMTNNPAYIFLTAIRGVVIYGEVPSASTWLTLLAWSLGAFVLGFVFFWEAESRYVRVKQ